MNTIIVKTNDATQTIAQVQVVTKDGKPTIIKAIDKVNYEFHDTAIDRAPNHIITKRKGKDLHVSFEEEGEESDLIIEGFYDSPDSALLGIAEDGEYYYYIPDTGETYDYVTQLEDGAIEGQALGGQSYVAAAVPWWIPAAAGLGLVGLVASSSNDKNPIAPPPNQGPVAVDDSVTTQRGTSVTQNIIGNDTDANRDPLTVKDFTVNGTIYQPGVTATIANVGTITVTEAGELTFTPETGYAGPVPPVNYTVTDGKGGEDTGTVTFTDVPNAPPVAVDDSVTTQRGTSVTQNIIGNDTDANRDPLTVKDFTVNGTIYQPGVTATIPNVGTITVTEAGELTFTPETGYAGPVPPVNYTVTDGKGGEDTGTVTFTDVPNAPPVAVDDSVTTQRGTSVTQNIIGNDTDANRDPLTVKDFTVNGTIYQPGVTATIPNVGTITVTEAGELTFTPETGYAGPVPPVNYTVTDGKGGEDTGTVTFTDVPNAPPVAVDDSVTTQRGTSVTQNIIGNDTDANGDPLTVKDFTVNGTIYQPGVTATIANVGTITVTEAGELTFTPETGYAGPVPSVNYTVTDGKGGEDTGTVTFTDVPNAPPVAVDDSVTTQRGTSVTQNIIGNDTDANGDPLTVKNFTVNGNTYQPGVTATIPNVGTITVTEAGELTFTPETGYAGPVPPVNYTVTDGKGGEDTGTVTFTDVPNAPPVAVDDSVTTQRGTSVTQNIIGNDTDANGDPLTVKDFTVNGNTYQPGVTATIPNVGTITVTEAGELTFTPETGYAGPVPPVNYTVTDGKGGEDTGTVTFTDVPNAPPVAVDDSVTTQRGTSVTQNIIGNDTDANGDSLTVKDFTVNGTIYQPGVTATIPNVGTITVTEAGELTFTPETGYAGPVPPVNYTVTDGKGGEDTGTVTFTDVPNAPPVAVDDSVTTQRGTSVTQNIIGNDTDANRDPLTVKDFTVNGTIYQPGVTATIPNVGTITVTEAGELTFTPETGYAGPVPPVNYTVTDGKGGEDTGTVTFTDVPNAPPVAVDDSVTTQRGTSVTQNIIGNDTDANGDSLTVKNFTVNGTTYQPGVTATIPNVGTITVTEAGELTFTPETGYAGSVPPVNYTVTDGKGGEDTGTVTFTDVPNAPPVAVDDSVTTQRGTSVTQNIIGNDTDANRDPLTVKDFTVNGTIYQPGVTATIANVGTITVTEAGELTFTPETGYAGPVPPVNYTVTDGKGGEDTGTVTFTDVPNAPPVAVDDSVTTQRGTSVTQNIIGNDTDANRDPLTVKNFTVNGTIYQPGVTATIPNVGTITVTEAGELTFTPETGYAGPVPPVNYTVTDGKGGEDTGTVTFTDVPNAPPVAVDDSVTTQRGTSVTQNIIGNDTDANRDPLTVKDFTVNGTIYQPGVTATIPNVGTITVTEAGELTFTPETGYAGPVPPVNYTVTDGKGGEDTGTVTFTDVPNAPPVAVDDSVTTQRGTSVTQNIIGNDTDANRDPLTVKDFTVNGTIYQPGVTATIPNVGTITVTEAGELTFTPETGYAGPVPPVNYTVTDGKGGEDTGTVTFTDVPNAPPVAVDDSVTTQRGTSVTQNIIGNDTDANRDPLTVKDFTVNGTIYQPGVTATIANVGTITVTEAGELTFTPETGYAGPVPPVNYTVTDGKGGEDTGTVTFTDVPNAPPVAVDDSVTTQRGTSVTQNIIGNDTDANGDSLTVKNFTVNGTIYQPGVTATIANVGTITVTEAGELTFTPETGYAGPVPPVNYTVTDGKGGEDTGTVTFTDVPNAPPVAVDDSVTTQRGTSVTQNIIGNDTDANRDPLTVKNFTVNGTIYQPGVTATIANVGTITVTEAGELTFTPETGYAGPVPPVNYTVTDGKGGEDTGTVTFTDVPNAPPVAVDDSVTTQRGTSVTQNIIGNDTDANRDPLTVKDFTVNGTIYQPGVTATIPNVGTITVTEAGELTFTPETGYAGPVPPVNYTVTDGKGGEDTGTVTFTDVPNAPPVAVDDSVTTQRGTSVTQNIIGNDTDANRDPLTVKDFTVNGTIYQPGVTATIPNVGTITVTEAGELTFTPETGYAGPVPPVNYTVTDGKGGEDTGTVTFTDVPNAPPVAVDDSVTTQRGTSVTQNIIGNDTDANRDPLTVKDFTVNGTIYQPGVTATIANVGTITVTEAGELTFTPETGYAGPVPPVNYTVTDGKGGEDTGTVTFTDVPNAPPVAVDDSVTTQRGTSVTQNIIGNDTDANRDPLTVKDFTVNGTIYQPGVTATIANVGTITVTEAGELTFTPETGYAGPVPPVNYTVTDGKGGEDTGTVTFTDVPNAPPVAVDDSVTTQRGTSVTQNIIGNDTDANRDPLTVKDFTVNGTIYQPGVTATIANVGTITVTEAGELTFTPETGYAGSVPPVNYTVTDGKGGEDTGTVTFTDVPNAPPVAVDDSVTTQRGTSVTQNIIGNDTDANRDPLTVKDFTVNGTIYQPGVTATIANVGTITVTEAGELTFTPETGYAGPVPPVNYTVTDGKGGEDTGTVTFTDVPNAPPVAVDDSVTTQRGTSVTQNIIGNDTDANRDPLTVKDFTVNGTIYQPGVTATIPNVGTITVTEAGELTFTPETGYAGPVPPVNYTVTDGKGGEDTGTVTFTDVPNAPPVAVDDSVTTQRGTSVTQNIIGNDTDANRDPLTVKDFTVNGTIYQPGVTATIANVGTITVTEAGELTFTPETGYAGPVPPVNYTVTDGKGGEDTGTVTFTDVPNAPPVAVDDSVTTQRGTSVTQNIIGNDTDANRDPLTVKDFTVNGTIYQPGVTATIPNVGTITVTEAGELTFTPETGYAGPVPPVNYTVTDGKGGEDTGTVTFTDVPNAPPVAVDDSVTTQRGTSVTQNIIGNDTDANRDPLTVKDFTVNGTIYQPGVTATIPNVGTITVTEAGELTFTPETGYAGPVPPVNYTVTDGKGGEDTGTVTFTDVPNAPPVAVDDSVTTQRGTSVTQNIIGNDTDANRDPLTVKDFTVNGTIYQPGVTATIANVGTITVTEAGELTFTPETGYAGPVPPVNYTVTDGKGGEDTGTVTFTDVPNAPPVAVDDSVTTQRGTSVTQNIIGNDTDANRDPLTVKDFTVNGTIYQPGVTATIANVGTITVTEAGELTFTPETGYAGSVPPVNYTVTDGKGGEDTGTVTFTDVPNAPPVAVDDSVTTQRGTSVTQNIIGNDTDANRDPLTVKDFTVNGTIYQPGVTATIANVGTITVTEAGELTFTPETGYAGPVPPVNYTVTDGKGGEDTGTVTFTDVPNAPPVAVDDSVTTQRGTSVTQNIIGNDTDANRDPLTVKDFTVNGTIYQPGVTATIANVGTITVTEAGELTFTPETGYAGPVPPVNYTVTDGKGGEDTGTVTFTDVPNAPPVAVDDSVTTQRGTSVTQNIIGNDTDANRDPLTVKDFTVNGTIYQPGVTATIANVGTITVTEAGELTFTPETGYAGPVPPVNYTVTDGKGGEDTGTVTFTDVPNAPPVAVDDSVTTQRGTSVTQNIIGNDTDANRDPLTVKDFTVNGTIYQPGVTATIPNVGTITVTEAGELTFTPETGYAGPVPPVNYTVTDGKGGEDTGTVTFTDVPNAPPVAVDDSVTTQRGTSVTQNIIGNDTDANRDPLTVKDFTVNGTIYQPGVTATIPNVGTITVTEAGELTFTPETGYAGPVPPVNYTVTDGKGGEDTGTVTFTDVPNAPPVAVDDSVTTQRGTSVTQNIIGNDTDANRDPLTVKDFTVNGTIYQPGVTATIANVGTITVTEAGELTFTPETGYAGPVPPVNYTVTDGKGGEDTGTVTFTDVPNAPPQAQDDTAVVAVGATIAATEAQGVLKDYSGNGITSQADTDPNGDKLAITGIRTGAETGSGEAGTVGTALKGTYGELTINADGSYSYKANSDSAALGQKTSVVDTFTYTVGDGRNGFDTAQLSITVNATNDTLNGKSTLSKLNASQLGLNGEFYGYNDSAVNNTYFKHADDNTLGNLDQISDVETIVNKRNGSNIAGSNTAAKEDVPDARFVATKINYTFQGALGQNVSAVKGDRPTTVDNNHGLASFLNATWAAHRVGAIADHNDHKSIVVEYGMGKTTDAAIRITGLMYLEEGLYDFTVKSDDGFRLMVDNQNVIQFNGNRGPGVTTKNNVYIKGGFVPVELLYWEQGGTGVLDFQYKKSSDQAYQVLDLTQTALLKDSTYNLNDLQDVAKDASGAWNIRLGDVLDGYGGNDIINGSDGKDYIMGGAGNDTLTGGTGVDKFIYSTKLNNGNDVIKDFTVGTDKITLSDVLSAHDINPATKTWTPITVTNGNVVNMPAEVSNMLWNDSTKVLSFDTQVDGNTVQNTIKFEGLTESYQDYVTFLQANAVL